MCLDGHKTTPVPRKRRSFIGLRQLQRLPRCAPCQGTYLGCGATPCIHLHLTQRASRDLISASLDNSFRAAARRSLTRMFIFELVIVLLLIGAVLSLCAGRIGVPYPALLAM